MSPSPATYGSNNTTPPSSGLLFFVVVLLTLGIAFISGCEKTNTITLPGTVDTVYVSKIDTVKLVRVDTVVNTKYDTTFVPRVDTLVRTRVDTVIRVDTFVSPPVHDTTIVTRYDTTTITRTDTVTKIEYDTTFVQKTDTLYLPSQVVHDTTWLYTQTNPTNPFAGGDTASGLMVLQVYESYYLVFWHAHFVGIIWRGGGWYDTTTTPYTYHENWRAYLAARPPSTIMPMACDKPTWQEAAGCLEPLIVTLSPMRMPLRTLK